MFQFEYKLLSVTPTPVKLVYRKYSDFVPILMHNTGVPGNVVKNL